MSLLDFDYIGDLRYAADLLVFFLKNIQHKYLDNDSIWKETRKT